MTILDLIPTIVAAIVSMLCVLVVLFQFLTGVPPLSSNKAERDDVVALLRQVGLTEGAIIYELGSGWGSLVVALTEAFPTAQIRGIEISPVPYWISCFRTRNMPAVQLQRRSFYDCDLSNAHAVTCYLMIKSMPRIAELLDRSLRPDTPVVSLSFWFRDREITASLDSAGQLHATALYLWPARRRVAF